jgi:hypothetical protein
MSEVPILGRPRSLHEGAHALKYRYQASEGMQRTGDAMVTGVAPPAAHPQRSTDSDEDRWNASS